MSASASDPPVHPNLIGITQSIPTELAAAWPRYWARMLDVILSAAPIAFALPFLFPSAFSKGGAFEGTSGDQLLTVVVLPFAMALDSVCYGLFGNTLGKWLAGINVLDIRGHQLSFREHIVRNYKVYVRGLACGIGIVGLFTLIHNYKKVRSGDLVSWDRPSESRVFRLRSGAWRTYATAVSYLALVVAATALGVYEERNPQQMLHIAALEINATAPKMVDTDSRFDGAQVEPGPTFRYNYTFTNLSLGTLDANKFMAGMNGSLHQKLSNNLCTSPEMQFFRDAGVSLKYSYADKDGRLIGAIVVTIAECAAHL
jgi:uncharacterized RDD family membrane protein YckC